MRRPRILLADDNPGVLKHVMSILSQDFEVVGAVDNGRDAVAAVKTQAPDLLVLDISMPIMTGIEAARRIVAAGQPPPMIFMSVHEDPCFIDLARETGALGYILKRNIANELVPAIRRALEGKATFPSDLPAAPRPVGEP